MRYLWLILLAVFVAGCDTTPSGGRALALIGEPVVSTLPGAVKVDGRVKNTAKRPYTGNIGVTFFDEGGKIVGTAVATVVNLPPGEEITYSALGTPPTAAWKRVEAKITTEFGG